MKLIFTLIGFALVGCSSFSAQDRGSPCSYYLNKDGFLNIKVHSFSDDTSIYLIEIVSPSHLNGRKFDHFNAQSVRGRRLEMALYHIDSEDKKTVEAALILDRRTVQDGVCVSAVYGDFAYGIAQRIVPQESSEVIKK